MRRTGQSVHARSATDAVHLARRFGDMISYQNDSKGSMANACKAEERERVFRYMDNMRHDNALNSARMSERGGQ